MPKPNYVALFAQIAVETDPAVKADLQAQAYTFTPPIPLPEGEAVDDYLLTPEEIELFNFTEDDYVVDNPGYVTAAEGVTYTYSHRFVMPDYAEPGYINIEYPPSYEYVLEGYVEENYINIQIPPNYPTGFISYVGKYYNDQGDST